MLFRVLWAALEPHAPIGGGLTEESGSGDPNFFQGKVAN